jgi:histidinol-phosphate aminotransferase
MTAQDIQTKALQRIRADVRAMQGYHVQPAQGLLKMDTMENPYRLPPELQQKLGEHLGGLEINRYPGERQEVLKQMLADYAGAPAGTSVLLGNGSDEIITLLALATAQPCNNARAKMLAPMPGFVMYPLSAKLQGLDFVGVNLTATLTWMCRPCRPPLPSTSLPSPISPIPTIPPPRCGPRTRCRP